MAKHVFKLPDIGEGIAESEIAAWHVKVGDVVKEEQPLVDMLTDKAAVELPSPVAGKVIKLAGEVGDQIAIGSVLVEIETEGGAAAETSPAKEKVEQPMADGAELVALVQENCFYHLEAPIERVTGWDTPYPHAYEWDYFPGPKRVGIALKKVTSV